MCNPHAAVCATEMIEKLDSAIEAAKLFAYDLLARADTRPAAARADDDERTRGA